MYLWVMVNGNFFDYFDCDGCIFGDCVELVGYSGGLIGENIVVG